MNLIGRFPLTSLYKGNRLVTDYLHTPDKLGSLFSLSPDLAGIDEAIRNMPFPDESRKRLHQALSRQYLTLDPKGEKQNIIDLLLSKNTFTVTAAHQPNLMGGPLYTIYKICGAIQLCKQLQNKYPEKNFIPFYWCGSEDHDTDELNHFFLQGKKYEWENAVTGLSFGRNKTGELALIVNELSEKFTAPHSKSLLETVRKSVKANESAALMYCRIIHQLFEKENLLIIDQDDEVLKSGMKDWFRSELTESKALELLQPTLSFLKEGYHVQANPRAINLFAQTSEGRIRIEKNGNKFYTSDNKLQFGSEELLNKIDNEPGFFSPNVILRPLYQASTLPDIVFTGGAGEISYWLELKKLFDVSGRFFPVLLLRNSFVLLSRAGAYRLKNSGITTEDLLQSPDQIIAHQVKQNSLLYLEYMKRSSEADAAFQNLVKLFEEDKALLPTAQLSAKKHSELIDKLGQKIIRSEKRKQAEFRIRVEALHAEVFPGHVFQERRENFLFYYNALGDDFISQLISASDPLQKQGLVFDTGL